MGHLVFLLEMRIKPRSATALLCFLSFFLFTPTSSSDFPTMSKKSRVRKSQVGRDFLSIPFVEEDETSYPSTPEEYIRNISSFGHSHNLIEDNDVLIMNTCNLTKEIVQQLKSPIDHEWIINDETLELLDNDPQELIQCTQPGDKVLFTLSGVHKFKRTMLVSHNLEFISTLGGANESASDWIDLASFTCPDSGYFLIVKAISFQATGFIISNCKASFGNGIILISRGTSAMFSHVNISYNKKTAFYVALKAQLTIKNSLFEDNHISNGLGGVISAQEYGNHLTAISCFFLRNTAAFGGAIYAFKNNNITIVSSILNENIAWKLGGSMFFDTGNFVFFNNSKLSGNRAKSGGSILCNLKNNITLIDSTLNDNNVSGDGGAVCCAFKNNVILKNLTLSGNNASRYGGAICLDDKNNITILNSNVIENRAYYGGAIFFDEKNRISIVNSALSKNLATWYGGSLYADYANNISLQGSTMSGNIAQWAGALYISSRSTITLSSSTLKENNASFGGAMFSEECTIAIDKSNFLFNKACFGGCLYGERSNLRVQHSKFVDNFAFEYGGCFYFESSVANFLNNSLFRNRARTGGGGICLKLKAFLISKDTIFDTNMADKGGGVAILSDSKLLCHNCTIFNNTAKQGGGLYIESHIKNYIIAQIQSTLFHSNNATQFGGGIVVKTFGGRGIKCTNIHVQCSWVLLLQTKFENNHAVTSGSILLTTKLDNIILGCDIHIDFKGHLEFWSPEFIQLKLNNGKVWQLYTKKWCDSWKYNLPPDERNGALIGTFGWRLNLTTNFANKSHTIGDSSSGFELRNIKSGVPLPEIRVVTIDGVENAHAPPFHERDALMLHSTDGFLAQPVTFSFINNTCFISGLISYVKQGNYTIQISPREDDILEATSLTIIVRKCVINEGLTLDGKFCQVCGNDSYNFHAHNGSGCILCPKNANCIGHYIIPNEGYWHKNPCQDKIKRCIVEEACKFKNRTSKLLNYMKRFLNCNLTNSTLHEYGEKQCNKGYEGRLCGSCKEFYGSTSTFECIKCSHVIVSILTLMGITFYLTVGTSLTIKGVLPLSSSRYTQDESRVPLFESIRSLTTRATTSSQIDETIVNENILPQSQDLDDQLDSLDAPNQQEKDVEIVKGKILEAWKILINFFQVTSNAATMEIKWTKVVLSMLQKIEIIGASTVNRISRPLDCIVSSASHATRAIWRVLFSLLTPISVVAILSIYWGYRSIRLHANDNLYFMKRLILTVTTVAYITYFDLTQAAVRVFNCVAVHDDIKFDSTSTSSTWIVDTSIECYKSTHLVLVGIAVVVLILVSIGFPVFCSLVLFARRAEIDTTSSWTYETLGFLSGPFKLKFIYWECVTMIKKALLSIIIVFSYSLGNQAQGLLILLVLVLFLYIHIICFPYNEEYYTLNYNESGSLLISCITYTLVQFFNVKTLSGLSRGIVSASLIAVNSSFVCVMLYKILKDLFSLLRAILESRGILVSENMNIFSFLKFYYQNRRSVPSTS